MSKFNTGGAGTHTATGFVNTDGQAVLTAEGGLGETRDIKSELYVLAIQNMVGEHSFYESADDRDARFKLLVRAAIEQDPAWVARLAAYVRGTLNLRSVGIVIAAEYAYVSKHGNPAAFVGMPTVRSVVNSVLQRADEPGEMLAYWLGTHGRKIPKGLKRGVADAATRLLSPYAALKYNRDSADVALADVLELTHPSPRDGDQASLFKYLVDKRHGNATAVQDYALPMLNQRDVLLGTDVRALVHSGEGIETLLRSAGATWELVASQYGELDAAFWHAMIPQMGYMALLRNLRNFDEAGISERAATEVARRLSDPEQVRQSKQLPIRFYSAWKAVAGMRWAYPLEIALEASLENVPKLGGRTLVLIDASGSMRYVMSERSKVARWEVAAVFGHALAARAENVDLYAYSIGAMRLETSSGASVLRSVEALGNVPQDTSWYRAGSESNGLWSGTQTYDAARSLYYGHDRVVLITDEQTRGVPGIVTENTGVKTYTFNIGGYSVAHAPMTKNSYTFGGLSDAGFTGISLLEKNRDAGWPF